MLIGIRVLLLLAICSCSYAFICSLGPVKTAVCIVACQLQNCGTGSCDINKNCHCERCIAGPPWSITINLSPFKKGLKALQTKNMTVNENVGTFQLCATGSGDYMNRTFLFAITTSRETATANVDYNPNAFPTLLFFTQNASRTQCSSITIYNDNQMESREKFGLTISHPIIENNAFNITMSMGNKTELGNSLTFDVNILDDNDTSSVGSAAASMLLCVIAFMATML